MKRAGLVLSLVFTFNLMMAQEAVKPVGLSVGDKAPAFSVKDHAGNIFDLKKVLKKGPVILVFYRGQWCPYCNKELSFLNDSLSFLQAKGASLLAISPETDENIKKTIGKTKAAFPVVSDSLMTIMQAYNVNFAVDESTVQKYKTYGIDFNEANGNNGANLPIPATYIIGKDGIIKYVYFNPDYRKRASVKDLLDHL